MKTLELEIKKKLFIVELPEGYEVAGLKNGTFFYWDDTMTSIDYPRSIPLHKFNRCIDVWNASEITEDIAKELVQKVTTTQYKNYRSVPNYFEYLKDTALESFISAIEAKGYYWGENPYSNYKSYSKEHLKASEELFNEAELKTFDLSKTLIFEIL